MMLALAALSAAIFREQLEEPTRLFEKEGVRAEALGACEISESSVACWDMDGRPDKELLAEVKAALESSVREVEFAFRRKTRYLAIDLSGIRSVSYRAQARTDLSSAEFKTNSGIDLIRFTSGPSLLRTTVSALASVSGVPPVDVEFREGKVVTYEGVRLEIGPASDWNPAPGEGSVFAYPNQGRAWRIVFGEESNAGEWCPAAKFQYQPLTAEDMPIRYVDTEGNPISEVAVLGRHGSNAALPAVFFRTGQQIQGAFSAVTNVNPKNIAKLRIITWRELSFTLGPFPLDPNSISPASTACPGRIGS
jgi:hypothetical protein